MMDEKSMWMKRKESRFCIRGGNYLRQKLHVLLAHFRLNNEYNDTMVNEYQWGKTPKILCESIEGIQ